MLSIFKHLNAFNICCLFDVGGSSPFLAELPVLDNEMFYSAKPGLSAYADNPEMVSSLSGLINYIEHDVFLKHCPSSPTAWKSITDRMFFSSRTIVFISAHVCTRPVQLIKYEFQFWLPTITETTSSKKKDYFTILYFTKMVCGFFSE